MIDEKYDAVDALKAGFPAGTVSGAPKIRAMQIIEELKILIEVFMLDVWVILILMEIWIHALVKSGLVKNGKLFIQAEVELCMTQILRMSIKKQSIKLVL